LHPCYKLKMKCCGMDIPARPNVPHTDEISCMRRSISSCFIWLFS